MQKHNDFKRARSDYTSALDQFNFHRRYHYSTTLKNWGEAGQTLESYRINKTQEMITVLVERLRVMIDRLLTVCTDLEAVVATMDAEKVSQHILSQTWYYFYYSTFLVRKPISYSISNGSFFIELDKLTSGIYPRKKTN